MQRGEIYLASFPFGDVPDMKLRPVLLLTAPIGTKGEVLVAYISSVVPPILPFFCVFTFDRDRVERYNSP